MLLQPATMINKEHFTNGLVQVAIVLSLLRTDLDIYLVAPEVTLPGYALSPRHFHETIFDSVADYSQNNAYGRLSVGVNLKSPSDDERRWTLSSLFSDLHSLANYQRFDRFNTDIHTWLVSDPGSARPTLGSVPVASGSSDLATGTTHESGQPILTTEIPSEPATSVNESNHLDLYPNAGDELTKEDMELINILYMQDIDLGVGREAYDVGSRFGENCTDEKTENKEVGNNSNNRETILQTTAFAQLDLAAQYTVDNETGELIWLPSSTPEVEGLEYNQLQQPTNDATLDVPDTPQMELLHLSLTDNHNENEVQQPAMVGFERQSSLDQQWNDLLSVLSTPSDIPDFMLDVASGNAQYDPGTAVVQNASMCSAAPPAINETGTVQPSSSHSFPFSSIQGFDSVLTPFFVADCVNTEVQQHCSECNTSLPTYESDQPNHGLFGNLSILPLMSLESGEPESYGGNLVNYSLSEPQRNYSAAFEGLVSPSITYNQMENQSASGVLSVIESNENDVQDIMQMLQSDLADDLDLIGLMDDDEIISSRDNGFDQLVNEGNWSSDSAVSSMDSPLQQSYGSSLNGSEVYGASGGLTKYDAYDTKSESSDYYESSFPSKFDHKINNSANYTDMPSSAATNAKNVRHNHTYPLPNGRKSREELEEDARREKEERATRSRDEKRAKAMKIPMTMEEMIDSSVEQFTELLARHRLSESQQQLVRDIRRRGKNKMAAQNCRKRKMEVIQTIDEQVMELRDRRNSLLRERGELDRNAAVLKDKFKRLESELFRRLHDESGREYDPSLFSLLQTDDGGLYIVPRNNTDNDRASASDKSHDDKSGRKRKSKRKD